MKEDTAVVTLVKQFDSAKMAGELVDSWGEFLPGLSVDDCITRTEQGKWQVRFYAQGELIEAWRAV